MIKIVKVLISTKIKKGSEKGIERQRKKMNRIGDITMTPRCFNSIKLWTRSTWYFNDTRLMGIKWIRIVIG